MEVFGKVGFEFDFPEAQTEYDYSPQYWCGWILAYCQWFTGLNFASIEKHISMEEIERLYPTLHEAAEDKFVDTFYNIVQRADGDKSTNP